MTTQFTNYSDIIFDAFCLHSKRKDIIDKKQEILDRVNEHYNAVTDSILFVGFNPAILSTKAKEIYVTNVSDRIFNWLTNQNIAVQPLANLRKFDTVVAVDEYLTFAKTDSDQRALISQLCFLTNGIVVTTVKDYKNQDFKEREYSQPAIIKTNNQVTAFTEIHDWDLKDKNTWQTSAYKLTDKCSDCLGTFDRRTLYFKQLAKFSIDSGALDFLVHKNLMYKSLIRRNYEHVISIQFDKF